MELLLSNFLPLNVTRTSSRSFIESSIKNCSVLKIATGYISSEALIELKRIIEVNRSPKLDLLIGMHYFDGFTRTQYEAANELSKFLVENDLGNVFLSTTMKFHGKMYSFIMNDNKLSALVGSSNLGSIYDKVNRLYEADVLLKDEESKDIHNALNKIIDGIGNPLAEVSITAFNEFNKLLENHENVEKVNEQEFINIINPNPVVFEIPVKTEPKSNLNAFFGKGRVDKRGYEMPRPWYEVEIIVSKSITSKRNYPAYKSFTVITDDRWSFKCETNGDFSKNLRSKDDLKILGKWIKGRLEESGALKIGFPVVDDVLMKYGRNSITLSSTLDPNVWFLNFSAK